MRLTPLLEAVTKWFDRFDKLRVRLRLTRSPALRLSKGKLTILSKVEGPMGLPPWSRGPLLYRGREPGVSPLVEHGASNPVFDIT